MQAKLAMVEAYNQPFGISGSLLLKMHLDQLKLRRDRMLTAGSCIGLIDHAKTKLCHCLGVVFCCSFKTTFLNINVEIMWRWCLTSAFLL